MNIWITAIGVGCIGAVYGYMLFYSYKRHHTPIANASMPIKQVVELLAAIGAGGVIGGAFLILEGVNYIGPYGIGLLVGVVFNVILTMYHEGELGGHKTQGSDQGLANERQVMPTRVN